jgi:hypothetical protein
VIEVIAEQHLELANPRHPGYVGLAIAAGSTTRSGARLQQAALFVVAQRPGRHTGPAGRLTDGKAGHGAVTVSSIASSRATTVS